MIVRFQTQTLLKRIHTSDLVASILVSDAASFAPQTLDAHTCIPSVRESDRLEFAQNSRNNRDQKYGRLLGLILRLQGPNFQNRVTHLL